MPFFGSQVCCCITNLDHTELCGANKRRCFFGGAKPTICMYVYQDLWKKRMNSDYFHGRWVRCEKINPRNENPVFDQLGFTGFYGNSVKLGKVSKEYDITFGICKRVEAPFTLIISEIFVCFLASGYESYDVHVSRKTKKSVLVYKHESNMDTEKMSLWKISFRYLVILNIPFGWVFSPSICYATTIHHESKSTRFFVGKFIYSR